MNEDLRLIYIWLCANRLSLNVDKTEFVVFRPPRTNTFNRFTLKLNRTTLYESPKIKYLGLILDKTLSWKFHIFELRKKLSRAVGILYKMRALHSKKCLAVTLLLSVPLSHVIWYLFIWSSGFSIYHEN